MRLTIDTAGEGIVERTLRNVEGRLQDYDGAWPQMTTLLRDAMEEQFKSEGKSGSAGWAPLAPSTIAAKRASGTNMAILHDTLRLQESLTVKRAREGVDRVLGNVFEFGTSVPYAVFHQTGTATMPRRRPVQLSNTQRARVALSLQRYIMGSDLT